jgi:SAM-dependent methyltransferase
MTREPGPSLAARAWDDAARGYDAYFGPRFAPYLSATIGALAAHSGALPPGAIVVPCVGPGRELAPLARAFPGRTILGSDLAGEMVKLARGRAQGFGNVQLAQGDATALAYPDQAIAAVLSVFGLQLLPEQPEALAAWVELLAPGGFAVVMFWPRDTEASGPFHSMRRLLHGVGLSDGDWEAELVPRALARGARLRADIELAFPMRHDDAQTMWNALTRLGPLRALALKRGQALIDALGAKFVAELPEGRIEHTPAARLLVLERAQ